jgi:F-type H+-transporting ATPase subunit delta
MPRCWTNWLPRSRVAERATIARPYAKAAFAYARQANAFAAWSTGLATAAEIVADPRVAALTKNPRWTAPELAKFISGVAGPKLDDALRNFLSVLAENRRLLLLPHIAAQYEALRASVENIVDVDVASAVVLDGTQAAALSDALSRRFRRQVRMHTTVDQALLGGAVVRAGDLVIDGSLKGRLERLTTELTG